MPPAKRTRTENESEKDPSAKVDLNAKIEELQRELNAYKSKKELELEKELEMKNEMIEKLEEDLRIKVEIIEENKRSDFTQEMDIKDEQIGKLQRELDEKNRMIAENQKDFNSALKTFQTTIAIKNSKIKALEVAAVPAASVSPSPLNGDILIRLLVNGISKLPERLSGSREVNGKKCKWVLSVKSTDGFLSVCISAVPFSVTKCASVFASYMFNLVAINDRPYQRGNLSLEGVHEFELPSESWGFIKFFDLKELLGGGSKYVRDDKIIVEAVIREMDHLGPFVPDY